MKDNHIKLHAHLNKLAKKESESNSLFRTTYDLEHWIESGVNSVEEFEHTNATTEHYELYREMYGIKPRWILYNEMTTEEIVKDINNMLEEDKLNEIKAKEKADKLSRLIQKRKANNAYRPNNVFADLKSLIPS